MKVLLITETFTGGGAEAFVVRLANSLVKDNEVYLINLRPDIVHNGVVKNLSKEVKLVEHHFPFRMLALKSDGIFRRLNIDSFISIKPVIRFVARQIEKIQPEVVHSHIFMADYIAAKAIELTGLHIRHIITNHGDYLLFEKNNPQYLLNYKTKRNYIFKKIDKVVNISEEQENFIKEFNRKENIHTPSCKIYNGYIPAKFPVKPRAELGITDKEFVVGMIARGIKEKGWKEMINAFKLAKIPHSKLLLIGGGNYLDSLKKENGDKNIIFLGNTEDPLSYISMFDIGCLPSYYAAESLPTSIIEYLYCNKPVIATNVGEIQNMLESGIYNITIDLKDGRPDVNELANALKTMYKNILAKKEPIEQDKIFEKFRMDKCKNAYEKVYKNSKV